MSAELLTALQDWLAAKRDEDEHMAQSRAIFQRLKEAEARVIALAEGTLPTSDDVLGILRPRRLLGSDDKPRYPRDDA